MVLESEFTQEIPGNPKKKGQVEKSRCCKMFVPFTSRKIIGWSASQVKTGKLDAWEIQQFDNIPMRLARELHFPIKNQKNYIRISLSYHVM